MAIIDRKGIEGKADWKRLDRESASTRMHERNQEGRKADNKLQTDLRKSERKQTAKDMLKGLDGRQVDKAEVSRRAPEAKDLTGDRKDAETKVREQAKEGHEKGTDKARNAYSRLTEKVWQPKRQVDAAEPGSKGEALVPDKAAGGKKAPQVQKGAAEIVKDAQPAAARRAGQPAKKGVAARKAGDGKAKKGVRTAPKDTAAGKKAPKGVKPGEGKGLGERAAFDPGKAVTHQAALAGGGEAGARVAGREGRDAGKKVDVSGGKKAQKTTKARLAYVGTDDANASTGSLGRLIDGGAGQELGEAPYDPELIDVDRTAEIREYEPIEVKALGTEYFTDYSPVDRVRETAGLFNRFVIRDLSTADSEPADFSVVPLSERIVFVSETEAKVREAQGLIEQMRTGFASGGPRGLGRSC